MTVSSLRRTLRPASRMLAAAILLTAATGCELHRHAGETNSAFGDQGVEPTSQSKETNQTELSYWVNMSANAAGVVKTYADIAAYKETQRRTGVSVRFIQPPVGQEKDQFNLMLSSGKLPDLIEYNWLTIPGGPGKALNDGTIIKLNDYIDRYAPNFKKLLGEHPEWRKMITADDGSIYEFPFIRGDDYLTITYGMALRQDWLDKVGMKTPITLEEWHAVLRAFKEKDPNGNGKADDIPLLLNYQGINAFLSTWNLLQFFYQENGKVKYGPMQPAFKDALSMLGSWYQEGLIDPDFAATDAKLADAKMTNNQIGALALGVGSGIGKYTDIMRTQNPAFKLTPAPYPVLKKGDKPQTGQKTLVFPGDGVAITKDNKHIAESVKWLDYKYGSEGHMLFNFGIEGESYKLLNGYPTYTDLIMRNPQGLPVTNAMAKYALPAQVGPFVQDRRYMEQYAALPEQKEAIRLWMEPSNDRWMPGVTFTREESDSIARIQSDVESFQKEMINKFIMGVEPIDNFEHFQANLKKLGIETYIQYTQNALDRYNKR